MFFYMYAFIEFFGMFLDTNIIPTANVVYPVRGPDPFTPNFS